MTGAQIIALPQGQARAAALLSDYEQVCKAVSMLASVDDWRRFDSRAEAVRVFAERAGNRQLEVDAARARILAERQLGMVLAAMREAGELRRRGERARKCSPAEHLPPTLEDLRVDRKLAARAVKLAALDDFADRLDDWHETLLQAERRVTTRLMTGPRRTGRNANDFYPTPLSIVAEVCRRWRPRSRRVCEPCCGDGRFAAALEGAGMSVLRGDVVTGQDFFALEAAPAPALATNPPWGRIRDFIDHAFAIGVAEMCLVVPERLFACDAGRWQFERHRPARFAMLDWREDYLGKGGQADRAPAVAIWDGPCAGRCDFEIWNRQTQGETS